MRCFKQTKAIELKNIDFLNTGFNFDVDYFHDSLINNNYLNKKFRNLFKLD